MNKEESDRDIRACIGMFENPDEKTKEICKSFIDNVCIVRQKHDNGKIEDIKSYRERVIGLYQAMFVLGADHSILDEIMERVYPDWNEKWRGPKPCRHVLCVQGRLLR